MGRALAAALRAVAVPVRGPLGRGATCEGAAVVLLCVPDREIGMAAAHVAPGSVVGHPGASADVSLLAPHDGFVMHPLLSVVDEGTVFAGATAAVEGASPRALATAYALAARLGMHAREIPSGSRALYHAAASAASNYLVTVEGLAETLAAGAGLDRAALAPLVRSTVENWVRLGADGALTGPIVRGDDETVTRQRAAVALAAPQALALWDALTIATRALAARRVEPSS